MPELISQFQSTGNKAGSEPVPDSILINDGKNARFPVEAGKTYLFRIINFGAFPSFFFNIEDHDFQIVEMDGVYTVPTTAKTLLIGNAMRYGILLMAKKNTTTNFDISAVADESMFATPFQGKSLVASGSLQYDASELKPIPRTKEIASFTGSMPPPIDDVTVLPLDGEELLGPVDKQIVLNFSQKMINGLARYFGYAQFLSRSNNLQRHH